MLTVDITPEVVTSKRRITYRESSWRVHEFEVLSGGEAVCRVSVLKMQGSLMVWVGGAQPALGEVAIGLPEEGGNSRAGLASTLMGPEGAGTALARRLAASLSCVVYVACGAQFDRFTIPLVEKGLLTEIKGKPEFFK